MQFTRISQITKKILELPFAERPSERFAALQCGPWGRLAGAGCSILASSPLRLAGEGQGVDLGGTRVRFVGWKGARNGQLGGGGAPAASGASRRGWLCRRRGPPAAAFGWAASCGGARGGRRGSLGRWNLRRRGCARGDLPGGRGGRRWPQARAGRNGLIGDERRGRARPRG
jgi:hypothetical protein